MSDIYDVFSEIVQLVSGNFLVDALAVGGLGALCIPVEFFIQPNHRLFRLDDPSIQFPMTEHERVPNIMLIVLSVLFPAIAIVLLDFYRKRSRKYTVVALLAFAMAMAINLFVTGLVKLWIGNTRPDLISRCIPEAGTPRDQYVTFEVCTQTNQSILNDGFRSTPSGHSSNSFCGLGFLSLWLAGQFGLWRSGAKVWQILSGLAPLVLALYIAVSRIADYRHHWFDVLLGSVFGSTIAYLVYFHYYPSVRDPQSHNPTVIDDLNATEIV